MSPVRILLLLSTVCALAGAGSIGSGTRIEARPRDRDWVSTVVTRISEADRKTADGVEARGSVTIRVRIGADGSLDGVEVDQGSGSAALDERAIRAVRAASPFRPPPATLLSLEGYTELSFPLQLDGKPIR